MHRAVDPYPQWTSRRCSELPSRPNSAIWLLSCTMPFLTRVYPRREHGRVRERVEKESERRSKRKGQVTRAQQQSRKETREPKTVSTGKGGRPSSGGTVHCTHSLSRPGIWDTQPCLALLGMARQIQSRLGEDQRRGMDSTRAGGQAA